MKKIILPLAFFVFAVACHSKKSSTASTPTPPPPAPAGPPATVALNPNEVNDRLLAVAKTKFENASFDQLNIGHDLYFGKCTNCHGAKNIAKFPTENWPSIVEDMAHKARITDTEKQAVLQYVTAVSLASK